MKKLFFYFILVLSVTSASAEKCHVYLQISSASNDLVDNTNQLIAYLQRLYTDQVITEESLQLFSNSLKKGSVIVNPVAHKNVNSALFFTRSEDKIHFESIDRYISEVALDKAKLLDWVEHILKEIKNKKERRKQSEEQTKDALVKMRFVPIKPGKTVPYSFEVMQTLVTERMWAEIMGDNPAFVGGIYQVVTVKGKPIKVQSDLPVRTFTFWSALEFANKVSELHGLQPVYDLSELTLIPGTQSANGRLAAIGGKLKINALDGDVTKAEGYRLPTELEQVFLMSNKGQSTGPYFPGINDNNFQEYAWVPPFNESRPIEVAQLKIFVVDGQPLYDLFGNLEELSYDISKKQLGEHIGYSIENMNDFLKFLKEKGESTDPKNLNLMVGPSRSARGGYWGESPPRLRPLDDDYPVKNNNAEDCVGLRLVRTLK